MSRDKKIDWYLTPVIESKKPMWRKYANCRNAPKDLFIITKGKTIKQALSFCNNCVVKKACLEYALDNNCVGIWGETTQKQRAKIKRQQRLANAK